MTVSLSPFAGAGWQFFDNNGTPLAGGKLYTYAAGTSSALTTYTSVSGATANTNPIILNSGGRVPYEIWATTGLNYKFILKDSSDVLIGTWDNIPIGSTAVSDLQTQLASSTGASMIGYKYDDANAVATTVQAKLFETVSVKDFGAVGDGVTDDTAAIQAAVNSLPTSGGNIFVPVGTYLITAAITLKNYVVIQGEGDASQFIVNTDIEVFNSSTATASTAIFGAELRRIYINKTVSTATTKYDVHFQNPNFCNLINVHIKSGHDDTQYSNTNVGGVYFERPIFSTSAAYCNTIKDCWIQNNCINFNNITDSTISGGWVWGHTRPFAIRIGQSGSQSAGAIAIEKVVGIICSKYNGGIYIDGTAINQIRIEGNEFDGNPVLDTGYGVLSLQQVIGVTITGNTFWGCDYHGIWAKDAVNWAITGNAFWKNNAADNSWDDIRLESNVISVSGCSVSGNSHLIDDSRTNKGYAVRLVTGSGGDPTNNSITGNSVEGNYTAPGFYIIGNNSFTGNVPNSGNLLERHGYGGQYLGTNVQTGYLPWATLQRSSNELLAANGIIDLAINTNIYANNPSGFAGHLYVTATRYNAPTQSRRTIYTAIGYGTTATITSVVSQDGSGGGSAFTVEIPSSTVTITIANPGVISWASHGLSEGTPVIFTTTGALPTGITAGTVYYVSGPTTNDFKIASSVGGAWIQTSGTQSGVHTCKACGIIRFTDTSGSGSQIAANMTFIGALSL